MFTFFDHLGKIDQDVEDRWGDLSVFVAIPTFGNDGLTRHLI